MKRNQFDHAIIVGIYPPLFPLPGSGCWHGSHPANPRRRRLSRTGLLPGAERKATDAVALAIGAGPAAVLLFFRHQHTGSPAPWSRVSPPIVPAQRPEEGGYVDAGAFHFASQRRPFHWTTAPISERNGNFPIGENNVAAFPSPPPVGHLKSKPAKCRYRLVKGHIINRNRHRN